MNLPPFTTRVHLEVEVTHWGTATPQQAAELVERALHFPAIKSVRIKRIESNHSNHGDKPTEEMTVRC